MRLLALALLLILLSAETRAHSRAKHGDPESDSVQCYSKIELAHSWATETYRLDAAFDTLRKYLTICPNGSNSMQGLDDLTSLLRAASQTKTEEGLQELRSWFITNRHISTWPGWYCKCLEGAAATYDDYRSALAVYKFLMTDSPCSFKREAYGHEYYFLRVNQIQAWRDTAVNDSMQYFDSTLPSIESLGLDSLLKDRTTNNVERDVEVLTAASVAPNPTDGDAAVTVTLAEEAYVEIGVYDVLGRPIIPSAFQGVLPAGNDVLPIRLRNLVSGTYYVRILSTSRQVHTLKLDRR